MRFALPRRGSLVLAQGGCQTLKRTLRRKTIALVQKGLRQEGYLKNVFLIHAPNGIMVNSKATIEI